MKKFLSCLLVMLVLVVVPALTVEAQAAETSGTCGENLTWVYDSETKMLTISGTGEMDDFPEVSGGYYDTPWINKDIQNVVISEGVTSIGTGAFHMDNLRNVTIPDSMISIGERAFAYCEYLESVEIPSSVTSIEDFAFFDCIALSRVELNEGLLSIGKSAFALCYSLDTEIPDSVTSIGDGAFGACRSLTRIKIPSNVTSIGESVFADCGSLISVVIPEGVTFIGDEAFYNCDSLTDVTISADVMSIGERAFHHCYSLAGIWVDKQNSNYSSDDRGVLFNKAESSLIQAPTAIEGAYSIPNSILSIGHYAFYQCGGLTSVTIPASVTSIGDYAFQLSTGLSTIRFTGDAPSFGKRIFDRVTANVYYPENNATWTEAVMQDYGGHLTWIPESANPEPTAPEYTNPDPTDPKPTEPKPTEPKPTENPFADVAEDAYYYDPVLWAVNEGITNGMDATHFAPAGTCTRAQIVTFLWRANGSPASGGTNPFTDVPADAWYTNAVLWAVENGITTGTSATTFSPDAGCTRGQVATFLWRSQGQPAVSGENIFTDIANGAYYYDAVLWAVANGITNGMGEGLFAPDATCTRGQIVTFLYRAMNE